MFLANKLNKGAGAPPATPDPQFNYVTMLLHGDGTNGAQNNTFLDSSTNNFTITRNGNTTQGSFSPYGSNWSNYFNGSSTLNVANNAVFTLPADFTIECWIFQTGAFQNRLIISKWPTEYYIFTQASGVIGFAWGPFNASGLFGGALLLSGSNAFALNTWTHVAVVRNSNTFTLYVNGVSIATATFSTGGTDSGSPVTIGDYGSGGFAFEGYISNARIVKGTAVYTSNFTPSTTPLTAISGTSLLTCADNRFIDDSTNNFTLTTTGTPSVQRFNPFGTSTAYSTSVIGGSLFSTDTSDLMLPNNAALAPQTSDFTFECWIYATTAFPASYTELYAGPGINGIFIGQLATGLFGVRQRTNADLLSRTSPPINQWVHIAVTRSGTSLRMFYNGVQQGATVTDSTNFLSGDTAIVSSSFPFNGYISNLRFVKGTAVYTSDFTPPTSPVTAITNTQLLANFTNGAIFDNAMMNDLETVGNAQISTSVVKYGTGSLAFDGTGDQLTVATSPLYKFGTGDFTIECWVYANSFSGFPCIVDGRPTGSAVPWAFYINSSGYPYFYNGTSLTSSIAVSTTTWTHIAVARSLGTLKIFVNGVQGYSSTITTDMAGGGLQIGGAFLGSYLNGYIDDLRITKGYARYTANFTPPTAAFPNIGPV